MYLDERSSLLLKDLINNPDFKNKDLEEKYGLSRRQVSYSIEKVNGWLTMNDLPKIERANNGFFTISVELLSYFKVDNQKELVRQQYNLSEKERVQLILLLILSKEDALSLIHLTSALLVSKNTVLNDLKLVQAMLHPHNLAINYSRQLGYEITGSEFQKRRLLLDTMQLVLGNEHGETVIEKITGIEKKKREEIQQWLEQVEQRLNLTFTDERMKQLPYILTVILIRIQQQDYIEAAFSIHYEELSDTKEYQAVELLLDSYGNIPREERLFITLNLLASNVSASEVLTDKIVPQLMQAVEKTLLLFERNTCIELKEKKKLIQLIFIHMKPAYYRIKYQLTTSNRYTENISTEFGELHYLIKQSIGPLEVLIGEPIPESEVVYFTMFIGGWLERQGDNIHHKIRAVVVCPNGLSVSKLMKNSLQKIFPEFLFLDSLSVREFQHFKLDYDLVFSPHMLPTEKKVYVVQQLPTEEEKLQLRKRVMQELHGYAPSVISVEEILSIVNKHQSRSDDSKLKKELQTFLELKQATPTIREFHKKERLDLTDFITEEVITMVPAVSDWQEAIRLSAAPLIQNGSIEPEYVEEIIRNHNYESPYMVLGKQVAIPHASPESGVNKTAMSLLCIKEGVPFSDQFHAHLVVVIAAKDKERHIRGLFQLSKLALNDEEVYAIAQANSKKKIIDIMRTYAEEDEDNG